MNIGFFGFILILIGIFNFPVFTLGMVLIYFDQTIIGLICLVISILSAPVKYN